MPSIPATLEALGITHVVWLPDSTLGPWEAEFERSATLRLVRFSREGEAWVLAAGLHLGGARPIVVMQSTGLFESGDALRNVVYDMHLPVYALVGYRSYLVPASTDTARRFAEPILRAWELDYVLLAGDDAGDQLAAHYRACQAAQRAGVALLAEGRG